jgi:hypothetical protein
VWDRLSTILATILDGNWVDIVTLAVALAYAAWECRKPNAAKFISKETGLRVAHGIALFPLFLLALSSVSGSALDAILHSHKIILSVAGFLALLAILEEKPPG